MYLVTAATRFEMQPFLDNSSREGIDTLITGVGPVETAVTLSGYLNNHSAQFAGIINFGVGGAYVSSDGTARADLLDICLAKTEVLGDFGVCLQDRIEPISGKELKSPRIFPMDTNLLELAVGVLHKQKIFFRLGNFVTVNCTTGTMQRGAMLEAQHQGLCENMEGASVARVCKEFSLLCFELRCISNLVEDRNTNRWQLKKACKRSGEVTAMIIQNFVSK